MAAGPRGDEHAVHETVRALRDALEQADHDRAGTEQRLRAEYQDRIDQLEQTVVALRDQLSRHEATSAAARQAIVQSAATETGELQAAIGAGRELIDQLRADHDAALAAQRREHEIERRQLREIIQELRRQLEGQSEEHVP